MERLYKLLNSIYLVPAIYDVIQGRATVQAMDVIREFGITQEDMKFFRDRSKLVEYHFDNVSSMFSPDYETLRKALADEFYLEHSNFWNTLPIMIKGKRLIDIGSGGGQLSGTFRGLSNMNHATEIDKDKGIDFLEEGWNDPYLHQYDIALLSEVLHTKNSIQQEQLLQDAYGCLGKGGCIVIRESDDPFLGYRMSKIKQDNLMFHVTQSDVINLAVTSGFNIKFTSQTNHFHTTIIS